MGRSTPSVSLAHYELDLIAGAVQVLSQSAFDSGGQVILRIFDSGKEEPRVIHWQRQEANACRLWIENLEIGLTYTAPNDWPRFASSARIQLIDLITSLLLFPAEAAEIF
jgi:hypothetical protein